jgi:hypothetical protein
MVLRIIFDVVRRKKWLIAFVVFQISLLTKVAWQFWPGADPWAAPLAATWYLTIPPGPLLQSRTFYQLPVSRRSWWLARWWMSTVCATVMATLGLAAAHLQAGTPQESVERLVVFAATAFLYAGLAMVLVTGRIGRHMDQPIDLSPKLSPPGTFKNDPNVNLKWLIVKALLRAGGGLLAMTLVLMAAPFVFARFLPHTFADIGVGIAVVMIVLAGATVFGFLHNPAVLARPNPRRQIAGIPPRPEGTAIAAKPAFADRLTGWRLALWGECRKQLIVFSLLLVFLVILWAGPSLVRHVPPLAEFLSNSGALPLASHRAHVTEFVTWGFLWFFVALFDAAAPPRVRSLRTLPMSTSVLSGLPLALGLISATMLWIVLAALHVLVLHSVPAAPRLDLFFAFAGLVTLSHALQFVTSAGPVAKNLIGFGPFAVVMMAGGYFIDIHTWRPEVIQPLMLIGGLMLLAASFLMTRISLAHNSRMYRPAPIVARLQ